MKERRVVITGMGTVNPLGNNVEESWRNLLAGKSGIKRITSFNPNDSKCKIAGEVKDFHPIELLGKLISQKDIKIKSRCKSGSFGFSILTSKLAPLNLV